MTYLLRDVLTGEVIEVQRPASQAPIDRVTIDGREYDRVYTNPGTVIRGPRYATNYPGEKGPPISRFSDVRRGKAGIDYKLDSERGFPMRVYSDGQRTDTDGCPIVETAKDVKHMEKQGFRREKD